MLQKRHFIFILLICLYSRGYSQRETVFDEAVTLYDDVIYTLIGTLPGIRTSREYFIVNIPMLK